jgi:hypothetical protein
MYYLKVEITFIQSSRNMCAHTDTMVIKQNSGEYNNIDMKNILRLHMSEFCSH